jgi:predicted amidohydrolase
MFRRQICKKTEQESAEIEEKKIGLNGDTVPKCRNTIKKKGTHSVLVIHPCNKVPDIINLQEEGFILTHCFRSHSSWIDGSVVSEFVVS